MTYDPAEWRDALVVILRGQLELECRRGPRHLFGHGDILFFAGLGLRTISNAGIHTVTLTSVSRRPLKAS